MQSRQAKRRQIKPGGGRLLVHRQSTGCREFWSDYQGIRGEAEQQQHREICGDVERTAKEVSWKVSWSIGDEPAYHHGVLPALHDCEAPQQERL